MADSLIEQCSKLNIDNTGEEDVIDLVSVEEEELDDKLELRLVGRLLSEKPVNFEALKRTMTQVWSLREGVVIRVIESNLYLFQFFHWKDRDKVLDGRPWCFEQRLLILQRMEKDTQPTEMQLKFSPFWARLYNLPYSCRSDEKVRLIGRSLGDVMDIEEDFLDLSPFRRIRVSIDCSKPLKRFQNIKVKDNMTVKINLKYERLPHFCFLCGLMSHTEKDCSYVNEEEKEKGSGWGMYIRASPRKGVGKFNEEVSNLKLKKALFCVKHSKTEGTTSLVPPSEKIPLNSDELNALEMREKHNTTIPCSVVKEAGSSSLNEQKAQTFSICSGPADAGKKTGVDDGKRKDDAANRNDKNMEAPPSQLNVDEITIPTFNIGKSMACPRKKITAKRSAVGMNKVQNYSEKMESTAKDPQVSPKTQVSVPKRKLLDTDVEMEDCEVAQKRSCSDFSLSAVLPDEVAEVGVSQPREQP